MRTMPLSSCVLVALLPLLACSRLASLTGSGCTKDGDCKGDRVCQAGQCVSPSSSAGSVAASPTGTGGTGSAKIGEAIVLNESTWTVIEAKDVGTHLAPTNQFGTAKSTTGRFIQIHYKVRNNGTKQETLLETPKVVDSGGREFGHVEMESDYISKGSKAAILETLQPSMEKDFYTMIEVPADATGLKVQLTGLGLRGDKGTVDIPTTGSSLSTTTTTAGNVAEPFGPQPIAGHYVNSHLPGHYRLTVSTPSKGQITGTMEFEGANGHRVLEFTFEGTARSGTAALATGPCVGGDNYRSGCIGPDNTKPHTLVATYTSTSFKFAGCAAWLNLQASTAHEGPPTEADCVFSKE